MGSSGSVGACVGAVTLGAAVVGAKVGFADPGAELGEGVRTLGVAGAKTSSVVSKSGKFFAFGRT